MCRFEGEYYITGIGSFCKFKPSQCLQMASRFVSVASYRAWIEETLKFLKEDSRNKPMPMVL